MQDGNCLFCTVSYCTYIENRQGKIRLDIVSKIVNEWVFYKDFVIDLSYRWVISSIDNYKTLPFADKDIIYHQVVKFW